MARIAAGRLSAEPTSPEQHDRRRRILRAASRIGAEKPLERVQMHEVAKAAGVAIGTLYRYFPSKVHLLVSALGREFARIEGKGKIPPGHTPLERMQLILSLITKAMQRDPLLTEAMTRAFMFADASAAAEVDQVGRLMDSLFARAMSDGTPTEEQLQIARVVSDVWLSNLVAWLTRRSSATDVAKRLELTVELLLGGYKDQAGS